MWTSGPKRILLSGTNKSVKCFFVVVQSLNHAPRFATPWTAAYQAPLSFTMSPSLLKFMSTESVVMLSNHLIFCLPLIPLPLIFPNIRVFSNELAFPIRWSNYWNFSHSPSNEYSCLIFFTDDWFDLLAVQGTLKGLSVQESSQVLQFESINSLATQPSL